MSTESIKKSLSLKRINREFKEMVDNPSHEYYAAPLEDEPFEWHFTIKGPPDTEFDGGIYHGVLYLPNTYPMKPPELYFITPNGRFEINTKICLSFTNFHPESWQPAWTTLISFLPVKEEFTGIGSLNYSPEERKKLAIQSKHSSCEKCGQITKLLKSGPDNANLKKDPSFKDIKFAYAKNQILDEKVVVEDKKENELLKEEDLKVLEEVIEEEVKEEFIKRDHSYTKKDSKRRLKENRNENNKSNKKEKQVILRELERLAELKEETMKVIDTDLKRKTTSVYIVEGVMLGLWLGFFVSKYVLNIEF